MLSSLGHPTEYTHPPDQVDAREVEGHYLDQLWIWDGTGHPPAPGFSMPPTDGGIKDYAVRRGVRAPELQKQAVAPKVGAQALFLDSDGITWTGKLLERAGAGWRVRAEQHNYISIGPCTLVVSDDTVLRRGIYQYQRLVAYRRAQDRASE